MENIIRKDCAFYNEDKDKLKPCACLTSMICKNKKCNFYLTKEQYKEKLKQFTH